MTIRRATSLRPGQFKHLIRVASSNSGRRSLAAKVLAATGDVETVQMILGHVCLDHSKPYLSVDQAVIRRVFEFAV